MTFFKKKITAEEIAMGLYHTIVSNAIKDNLKDQEGNVILTKKEQSLMSTQLLNDLFELYGKKIKIILAYNLCREQP